MAKFEGKDFLFYFFSFNLFFFFFAVVAVAFPDEKKKYALLWSLMDSKGRAQEGSSPLIHEHLEELEETA